ncbi:hypothetical protein CERSUDRAFT_159906 [Gelatoporia subvermispora B]|uniref:Protein kinase domain-containing protein n=1 Tax=Ceriporiopsis subvermispora (strain B) TaxID=914234 RepID=M2QNB6_CERS8|nr:hypothetical protein CERSUDRAFT_159906 [Gelatoporia subvermispora B]
MTNGTIRSYLSMNTATNRVDLLSGIVAGLVYMHELDIVHGDLKGVNILVNERGQASLADFGFSGFSRRAQDDGSLISSVKGGTARYAAPEVQALEVTEGPTRESDIYSLAMVVWEMFTGLEPYYNIRSEGEIYTQVYHYRSRPQRPEQAAGLGLSDELWALVERCWQHDPQDRPTVEYIEGVMQGIRADLGGKVLGEPSEWPLKVPPIPTVSWGGRNVLGSS